MAHPIRRRWVQVRNVLLDRFYTLDKYRVGRRHGRINRRFPYQVQTIAIDYDHGSFASMPGRSYFAMGIVAALY